jgi:tRNA(Ile)-lysidine synthase
MDCVALAALPAALRSRVLRTAALAAGAPAGALTERHVAALDALVTRWHGQGPVQLPGGVEAARQCGILVLGHPLTVRNM